MLIPESDHLMVSNLIAFASLVIAAISVIYALSESRRSKQLAAKALDMASEANRSAEETFLLMKSQPGIKNLPDISMSVQVGKISRISPSTDIITMYLINESPEATIIRQVFISAPFKSEIESPTTLNYLEELKVRLYIDEELSSPLSQHPRSNSEEIEALRERLEEELMKATIAVQMINQLNHHYEIDFNYNIMNEQFEGTPLRVSYRVSKVGVNM